MTEEILNEAVVSSEENGTEETNVMEEVVRDPNAQVVSLKKLLECGVHYGHQTRKWNPKMAPYIYCPRNGIYIIDLNKTKEGIETSYEKLKDIVNDGGKVLFVGTKDNAKEIVVEEATRSGSFYVTNRWLGGILTNFKTIQSRIKKLKDLEAEEADGAWDSLPKKEASQIRKLKEKLAKNLEGIKEMRKIPNALIVIDPMIEHNAVKEANKLNIPVFAICDTNCDPDGVNYVIPGNDDADKSVKVISSILADAIVEAKGGLPETAFAKEEGDDVTMKDAVRQADRENALRIAARREMQRERLEREKARRNNFENRGDRKPEETPAAEAPVAEETPAEEKVEEPKPKRTRKTTKKVEETPAN